MITVGIDYSLTSPCVCVSRDKTFSNSFFYFLNDRKKVQGKFHNILGEQHEEYLTDQERYENIASWVLAILADFDKKANKPGGVGKDAIFKFGSFMLIIQFLKYRSLRVKQNPLYPLH
jgi:hypothetical protein